MDLSIKVENSRLYIRTAVIIKSSEGYVLEKSDKGYAFLVGGKLKINEFSYDGVKREIMEEINFEASNLTLLKVVENIFNNGEEDIHEICFVYVCHDVFDGELPEIGFVKIKGEDLLSSDIRPEIIKKILIDNYEI